MQFFSRTLLFAAFAAVTTSASAQTVLTGPTSGYTYFNRAGATIDEHDSAVRDCHTLAQGLSYNNRTTTSTGGSDTAAVAAIIRDASLNVQARRRTYTAGIENCMVARGWRVVRMERSAGEALDELPAAEIRAQISSLVGADAPTGAIVRTFNNDMLIAGTVWSGAPRNLDRVSLSIQATAPSTPGSRERDRDADLPSRPRTANEPYSRQPRAASRMAPDATLLVLQTTGEGPLAGVTEMRFERVGSDPARPAWLDDGLPSGFDVALDGNRKAHVLPVPPGRWRLTSITRQPPFEQGIYTTTFCLGAPSFDIAAGEAVYAGAFDPTLAFAPNMDLAPIQASLADAPAITSRLRAASYVNGATYPCDGTYIYALEVQSAPFMPGYNAGSNYGLREPAPEPAPATEAAPEMPPTP